IRLLQVCGAGLRPHGDGLHGLHASGQRLWLRSLRERTVLQQVPGAPRPPRKRPPHPPFPVGLKGCSDVAPPQMAPN
ncbi:unnamed protein product, partial [Tetraodon nigroviridis]